MANQYTDIATNQQDGLNFPGGGPTTQPGTFNSAPFELGNSTIITAVYTIKGTEASGDKLYIARVPTGVIVDPQSTVSNNGAATTAFNFTVGDTDTVGGTVSADASRYSANLEIHAATTTVPTPFTGGTVLNVPAEVTDESTWIVATLGTTTSPTASGKIVFRIRLNASR